MKKSTKQTELKVAVSKDLDTLFAENELINDEQAIVIVGGKRIKDIANNRKCSNSSCTINNCSN